MGPRKKSSSFQRASANTRTPVTEKPVSSKLPVSSEPVAKPPPKSLWEQICEEYEAEKPAFPEECKIKREAMIRASLVTEMVFQDVSREPFLSVPRVFMISPSPCPQVKPKAIDSKTCSPKDYLETFIFPVLLPGVARLLHQAKKEKCFERKRTKFIACDFLTEWLYNHNPKRTDQPFTEFFSIPFVAEWLKQNPRPSIPLSLLLTEEEAALLIQSFWRGYL